MAYDPNYDPRKTQRRKNISNTEFLKVAKDFAYNHRKILNILMHDRKKIFFPEVEKILTKIDNSHRIEMTVSKRDELNNLMWTVYNKFVMHLASEKELIACLQKPTVLPDKKQKN